MSEAEEGSYEHACMRAELLGLPLPDKDTFQPEIPLGKRSANDDEDEIEAAEREACEEEEKQTKILEDLDTQKDDLRNVTGGLEELTNILSLTQTKINKFKTVCGSIKNLFKLRGAQLDGEMSEGEAGGSQCATDTEDNEQNEERQARQPASAASHSGGDVKQLGQQIESSLTSQNDKLDALLSKAENAEISMQSQNKQMRAFLR